MFLISQIIFFALITNIADGSTIKFIFTNSYNALIWLATETNGNGILLNSGGWSMNPSTSQEVDIPTNWAGRFWARTYCDTSKNYCQTGDCGTGLYCNGNGGIPPMTTLQVTTGNSIAQTQYSVSLTDGFNIGISITPVDSNNNPITACGIAGCNADLNTKCPQSLRILGSDGTTIIACASACIRYPTDTHYTYCCNPTCDPNSWPPGNDSALYFKSSCNNAISYALDSSTLPETCPSAAAFNVIIGNN